MTTIGQGAAEKLTGSLRARHRQELEEARRGQILAKAKRAAGAEFDIKDALASGNLRGAMAKQKALRRADAVDRGTLTGLQAAQYDERRRFLEGQQRQYDANFKATVGSVGGTMVAPQTAQDVLTVSPTMLGMRPDRAQLVADERKRVETSNRPWLDEDEMDAGAALGSQRMVDRAGMSMSRPVTAADFDSPDPARRNLALVEQTVRNRKIDEAQRYRAGQVPADVAAAREAGAKYALEKQARMVTQGEGDTRAVPVRMVNGRAVPDFGSGGIMQRGGQNFRSSGGRLSPTFDEPFLGRSGARQTIPE